MEIPEPVTEAANELIESFGGSIRYLGPYEGVEVYLYQFPETADVGFPILFLWKDGAVREVQGVDSLSIIEQLVED